MWVAIWRVPVTRVPDRSVAAILGLMKKHIMDLHL
jgi:hypothetical protein